jgi:hypothetical protein
MSHELKRHCDMEIQLCIGTKLILKILLHRFMVFNATFNNIPVISWHLLRKIPTAITG